MSQSLITPPSPQLATDLRLGLTRTALALASCVCTVSVFSLAAGPTSARYHPRLRSPAACVHETTRCPRSTRDVLLTCPRECLFAPPRWIPPLFLPQLHHSPTAPCPGSSRGQRQPPRARSATRGSHPPPARRGCSAHPPRPPRPPGHARWRLRPGSGPGCPRY
jgi:hypothetical protein